MGSRLLNNKQGKPKIAVVTASDGTMVILLFAQLETARDCGYQVHGVCSVGEYFDKLEDAGIVMHPIEIKRKMTPFADMKVLFQMVRLFRRERFDIVHTHTPKCSLLGQLAAKIAGVPVVVNTVHGYYFHENMRPLKRWFYIAMEWIASRCSSVILSQNSEDIETAVKLHISRREKLVVLGNGVDLKKFDPQRFDQGFRDEKRREIGLPRDAVVIGIIARLVKEKGLIELCEAFKRIVAEAENVWLVVIGPEDKIKADVVSGNVFAEYGIEDRTIWLGIRDDIPELVSCMDIYALPSWREGFPRSAIEAASMGLPIVATNIRGCRQVVEDGQTGFLVPLKDSDQLAEKLLMLVKDESLRKRMGQAGFDKSRREFDERKVCDIVTGIYEKYLNKH